MQYTKNKIAKSAKEQKILSLQILELTRRNLILAGLFEINLNNLDV